MTTQRPAQGTVKHKMLPGLVLGQILLKILAIKKCLPQNFGERAIYSLSGSASIYYNNSMTTQHPAQRTIKHKMLPGLT